MPTCAKYSKLIDKMSTTAVQPNSMLERAIKTARNYEYVEDFIRDHRVYYDLLRSYGEWENIERHMRRRSGFRPGLRVLFGI